MLSQEERRGLDKLAREINASITRIEYYISNYIKDIDRDLEKGRQILNRALLEKTELNDFARGIQMVCSKLDNFLYFLNEKEVSSNLALELRLKAWNLIWFASQSQDRKNLVQGFWELFDSWQNFKSYLNQKLEILKGKRNKLIILRELNCLLRDLAEHLKVLRNLGIELTVDELLQKLEGLISQNKQILNLGAENNAR